MDQCETELVRRLKGGDPAAYEEFTSRYGPRIYDVQCWLCGNRTTAEDLAQETVVAMFRSIGGFRGTASLYTWVYTLATRIAHRHLKRKTHDCVPLDTVDHLQGSDDSEDLADKAMLRDSVREALKSLPVAQRESVVLHCLQGLSHSETAKALDRPLGTVKWQIAQGLHSLREALEKAGVRPDEL